MANLAMLPALIPDIEKIYDVYFAAFAAEAMGSIMLKILFPGGITPEFRQAHTVATRDWWSKAKNQYTMKIFDTQTGEIVGMGLGDLYLLPRTEEERAYEGVPWLEGEARERAEKVLKPLWEAREKILGGQPYIYIHVIAVDPKHQGRKAGALMINWGIEAADRIGLPIYFESSPSTTKLYEKMGFETLDEKIVHKAETLGTPMDIEVPLMVRMPKGAGMSFKEWSAKGFPPIGAAAAATKATTNGTK